eukprot:scaffold3.g6666.t1
MAQQEEWDEGLRALLESGVLTGYALIAHAKRLVAAFGVLEAELSDDEQGHLSAAGAACWSLFHAAEQPQCLDLCGERVVICSREEAFVFAVSAGKRLSVLVHYTAAGVLVTTFARPNPLPSVAPLVERSCGFLAFKCGFASVALALLLVLLLPSARDTNRPPKGRMPAVGRQARANRSPNVTAKPTMRFGPVIRQPAASRHTGTVILLHGDGWAPVRPQLNLPHLKFVYPTAPTRRITVNMGMQMPGWFDITHLDARGLQDMMKGRPFDTEGTIQSVDYVKGLVAEEVAAGIPESRIVVGGFSQGGRIAYETVLTHATPLAGCIALSAWLEPSLTSVPQEVLSGLGCTNVEFRFYLEVCATFTRPVSVCRYTGMGHSSCPQELQVMRRWLLKVLPDVPPSRAEVDRMSARELKAFLHGRGVSTAGLLEKGDLVAEAHKQL